jgi:hypothetical protein
LAAAPILCAAILLDIIAFVIWDLGSRSPAVLAADIARGFRSARTLATGVVRLVVGFAFVLGAGVLVLMLAYTGEYRRDFFVLEIGAVFVALVVEALIGEPIRAALRRTP